jgi:NADPH:quinone reductase-like Zn-dependent oxidoreductase
MEMRAYVLPGVGAEPEILDAPKPIPGPGEILIRILSSSVNPVDARVAEGFFRSTQEYRYPAIFGRDLCGVVEELGSGVTNFAPGQTVWGFIKREHIGNGTFAQYVVCDSSKFVAPKPDGISTLEAGSMGLSAVTALECLNVLDLSDGDTVLINRASGGVGSFAVQIAASRKLNVIATGRPGAAEQYLRSLGANEVIDWTSGTVADSVLDRHPGGVDGVVDLVRRGVFPAMGVDEPASQAEVAVFVNRVLKPGGRFSSTTNGASDKYVRSGVGYNVHSEPTRANLEVLNALIGQGALRGCVTSAYPFDEIDKAFEHQRTHGRGKTAVVIDDVLWADTKDSFASARQ